jgi:uncharacterized membrane protein
MYYWPDWFDPDLAFMLAITFSAFFVVYGLTGDIYTGAVVAVALLVSMVVGFGFLLWKVLRSTEPLRPSVG